MHCMENTHECQLVAATFHMQVSQGQNWQNNMRHRVSVEDLIIILQRLPPGTPPVPSVAQGLHNLDSRACAALLKDLSKVGLPHHALTIFEWLRSLPHEHDLARLCDVFTYTTGGNRRHQQIASKHEIC